MHAMCRFVGCRKSHLTGTQQGNKYRTIKRHKRTAKNKKRNIRKRENILFNERKIKPNDMDIGMQIGTKTTRLNRKDFFLFFFFFSLSFFIHIATYIYFI